MSDANSPTAQGREIKLGTTLGRDVAAVNIVFSFATFQIKRSLTAPRNPGNRRPDRELVVLMVVEQRPNRRRPGSRHRKRSNAPGANARLGKADRRAREVFFRGNAEDAGCGRRRLSGGRSRGTRKS